MQESEGGGEENAQNEWTAHTSPADGRIYYYNRITKESRWDKPDELKTKSELKCAWREFKSSDDGKVYYYNVETKESQWMKPAEFVEGSDADCPKSPPPPQQQQPKDDEPTKPESNNRKKAIEAFRELLKEKEVPSTSTWDQVIKLVSTDPRYHLLSSVSDRKQAFNAYKVQKQKEEKDMERLRLKKSKEELENFLQNCEYINSSVGYKKANQLLGHLLVWNNVPERERKELFEDVLFFLEKREREEQRVIQKTNMENLKRIFEHLSFVSHETTWAQVQEYLLASKKFKSNVNLQQMDKEDALIVFEDHIRQLQRRHDEDMDRYRQLVYRSERKNRESFIELLDELKDAKRLNAKSTWKALFPVLRTDDRFMNMVGQPGSTPLDLFKFYVDYLKTRYDQDRRLIKSILRDADFVVDPRSTSFEEFEKVLRDDDKRFDRLDEENIFSAFESFVQRAIEEERERLKDEQRKRRKAEASFRRRLRKLELKSDSELKEFEKEIEKFEEAQMFSREEKESMFCEVLLSTKEAEMLMKKRKMQERANARQVEQLLPVLSSSSEHEDDDDDEEEEGEVRKRRKDDRKRRKRRKGRSHRTKRRKYSESRKKSRKKRRHESSTSSSSRSDSSAENSDESESGTSGSSYDSSSSDNQSDGRSESEDWEEVKRKKKKKHKAKKSSRK